jgi:hypothetical protein
MEYLNRSKRKEILENMNNISAMKNFCIKDVEKGNKDLLSRKAKGS